MATKEKELKIMTEAKKIAKTESANKESFLTIDVFDNEGKVVGKEVLNKEIFGNPASEALLAQVVRIMQANLRHGTAKVKGRAEVRGGGKKPWRQKGTGRARQGSIRSPQWRGGGIVHGKLPKDWGLSLPKKQRVVAVIGALSQKAFDRSIVLIKELESNGKTKEVNTILAKLPVNQGKSLLIVLPEKDDMILRATGNIKKIEVNTVSNLNTLEVLKANKILFTKKTISAMNDYFLKQDKNEEVKKDEPKKVKVVSKMVKPIKKATASIKTKKEIK